MLGSSVKLWNKLLEVNSLEFSSHCRKIPPTFEPRKGVGQVRVQKQNDETLTLFERGSWLGVHSKQQTAFSNVMRWRLDPEKEEIRIEHLRFGENRPVLLLTLSPVDEHLFKSMQPHACKEDTYFASVLFEEHYIHLNWRILGPGKHEVVDQVYT